MTTDGTVLASIAAGRATDQAGNLSRPLPALTIPLPTSKRFAGGGEHQQAFARRRTYQCNFGHLSDYVLEAVTGVDASDFTLFLTVQSCNGSIGQ
jgi:hypothetical protein